MVITGNKPGPSDFKPLIRAGIELLARNEYPSHTTRRWWLAQGGPMLAAANRVDSKA
jgi:hypothetical protein